MPSAGARWRGGSGWAASLAGCSAPSGWHSLAHVSTAPPCSAESPVLLLLLCCPCPEPAGLSLVAPGVVPAPTAPCSTAAAAVGLLMLRSEQGPGKEQGGAAPSEHQRVEPPCLGPGSPSQGFPRSPTAGARVTLRGHSINPGCSGVGRNCPGMTECFQEPKGLSCVGNVPGCCWSLTSSSWPGPVRACPGRQQ